jgi:hypothetical protein
VPKTIIALRPHRFCVVYENHSDKDNWEPYKPGGSTKGN